MADTFSLDISKFVDKAKGNVKQVVRKVGTSVLASVVSRSPVGNPKLWKSKPPAGYVGGRLRANWNVSIHFPDQSTFLYRDQSGAPTIQRGIKVLNGWDGVGDIYVMNSLPYVRTIEYDAHSSQAPAGMVRITVTEFQTYIQQAVAELPK